MDRITRLLSSDREKWYERAQVTQAIPHERIFIDLNRQDFLPELLPFNNHPYWKEVDNASKGMVASYGWIMYNMRTICIETEIVSPFCMDIINQKIDLMLNHDCSHIISQMLVDETYHTLLSIEGCSVITDARKLKPIRLPEFNFLNNIQQALLSCEEKYKKRADFIGRSDSV